MVQGGCGLRLTHEAPLALGVVPGRERLQVEQRRTGNLIWEHKSGIDQNITTVCCGWDNRGVAIGEGKVFLGQLDGTFVALDMKTGKRVWQALKGR